MNDLDTIMEKLSSIDKKVSRLLRDNEIDDSEQVRIKNPQFPCKKCELPIVMAYTQKNRKPIVLSKVQDEDDGEYNLNERGEAEYCGGYGSHTFHFAGDGTCKTRDKLGLATLSSLTLA